MSISLFHIYQNYFFLKRNTATEMLKDFWCAPPHDLSDSYKRPRNTGGTYRTINWQCIMICHKTLQPIINTSETPENL